MIIKVFMVFIIIFYLYDQVLISLWSPPRPGDWFNFWNHTTEACNKWWESLLQFCSQGSSLLEHSPLTLPFSGHTLQWAVTECDRQGPRLRFRDLGLSPGLVMYKLSSAMASLSCCLLLWIVSTSCIVYSVKWHKAYSSDAKYLLGGHGDSYTILLTQIYLKWTKTPPTSFFTWTDDKPQLPYSALRG